MIPSFDLLQLRCNYWELVYRKSRQTVIQRISVFNELAGSYRKMKVRKSANWDSLRCRACVCPRGGEKDNQFSLSSLSFFL